MTTPYIEDIGSHVGGEVTVRCWLHNKRSSGKLRFLIVRDGTGYLQAVVFKKSVPEATFAAAGELTHESSLKITGTVRADERAPGGYEMSVTAIEPLQIIPPEDAFPITPKGHGV